MNGRSERNHRKIVQLFGTLQEFVSLQKHKNRGYFLNWGIFFLGQPTLPPPPLLPADVVGADIEK